jgi:hypothetical protein
MHMTGDDNMRLSHQFTGVLNGNRPNRECQWDCYERQYVFREHFTARGDWSLHHMTKVDRVGWIWSYQSADGDRTRTLGHNVVERESRVIRILARNALSSTFLS